MLQASARRKSRCLHATGAGTNQGEGTKRAGGFARVCDFQWILRLALWAVRWWCY